MLTCASHGRRPKDLYGKSERPGEFACKEVYIVVIWLGESANWLRYCHRHFNQSKEFVWQAGHSQNFLVLCELPCQTNPRIS